MRLDGEAEDHRPVDQAAFQGQEGVRSIRNGMAFILATPHGIHRAAKGRLKPTRPPDPGFVAIEGQLAAPEDAQPPTERFG